MYPIKLVHVHEVSPDKVPKVPDIIPKVPDKRVIAPDNVPKAPDTPDVIPKVPDNILMVPDVILMTPDVPDDVPNMPDNILMMHRRSATLWYGSIGLSMATRTFRCSHEMDSIEHSCSEESVHEGFQLFMLDIAEAQDSLSESL